MRVRMCLMSILTVKVEHHARIEMINIFPSMIMYIYTHIHTVFIGIVYNIEEKKENERMPMILHLSECQTNRR